MVFGYVIGAETGAVVLLGQLQPRLEQFGERYCVIVEMIEHSEFQSQHYLLILCLGCVVDGYTCRSRSAQKAGSWAGEAACCAADACDCGVDGAQPFSTKLDKSRFQTAPG